MIGLPAIVLLAAATAAQQPSLRPLPRGPGLAARHPGDAGLEREPAVLFSEGFEGGDLARVRARWSDQAAADEHTLALVDGGACGRALRVTARPSRDHGGHLYRRLERGVERLFARFYVQFPRAGHGYVHHFVHLGGYRPATAWPQGGAGERPAGDERITVGIEPFGENGRLEPPGAWGFYAYWHEMKRSADGRYWGNGLRPIEPQPVPVGRWQCVEVMVALNSPGERDGELALWLDGQPVAHFARGARRGPWTGLGLRLVDEGGEPFEGFDWRTDEGLQLNFFWLLHYVTPAALERNGVEDLALPNVVLFDQIVLAEEYIGPLGR